VGDVITQSVELLYEVDRRGQGVYDRVVSSDMLGPTATSSNPSLPPDYHISVEAEYGGYVVRVIHASGELAASGRVAVHAGCAVFDQIVTDEAHRRLGLGNVVMLNLDAVAEQAGATDRLLVATKAGRALYERLGWTVLAPWSTAVLFD
jgi:GNAT superfamily N-acetyltransferase